MWLREYYELTWEHKVTMAGRVTMSGIRSLLERRLGSVLENLLRGILASALEIYMEASLKLTWERIVKQASSVIEYDWECTYHLLRCVFDTTLSAS